MGVPSPHSNSWRETPLSHSAGHLDTLPRAGQVRGTSDGWTLDTEADCQLKGEGPRGTCREGKTSRRGRKGQGSETDGTKGQGADPERPPGSESAEGQNARGIQQEKSKAREARHK